LEIIPDHVPICKAGVVQAGHDDDLFAPVPALQADESVVVRLIENVRGGISCRMIAISDR